MASAERQGMSIRKFRCELPERIVPGTDVTLDRSEETHLFKILRAAPGDVVELLDGRGRIADAEVKPGRLLTVRKIRQAEIPPRRIHLYIAPPRRQKMDAVLREATELGVWRIVPVICEFSVSEPDAASVAGRWTDAMFEACKQSGNPFLPATCSPLTFEQAVADAQTNCQELRFGSPEQTDSGSSARKTSPGSSARKAVSPPGKKRFSGRPEQNRCGSDDGSCAWRPPQSPES